MGRIPKFIPRIVVLGSLRGALMAVYGLSIKNQVILLGRKRTKETQKRKTNRLSWFAYTPTFPIILSPNIRFLFQRRGIDGITCVGNKVVSIRDTYPPGSDPQRSSSKDVTGSVLEVFDTDTGQAYEVPISGDHAVRVNHDMWESKQGRYHAIGREIWWQSGDGTIISTDVETGKNTRHFTLKDYKRSKEQGLFYWSDKYLYNINSTDNKDTLRIYSLHENKLIKEKELPDMKAICRSINLRMPWWSQTRKSFSSYKNKKAYP